MCENSVGSTANFRGHGQNASSFAQLFNLKQEPPSPNENLNHNLRYHTIYAQQLVGLGKTPHRSTLQSRQTFNEIQCVIAGDLASNRDRISASVPETPVLRTFVLLCSTYLHFGANRK